MSKSIGSNLKTVVRESINIPLTLLTVSIEVASDAAELTSNTIGGVLPTTKSLLKATGHFAVGAVNSELSEKELNEKLATITLSEVLRNIESGSGKAGQSTAKATLEFFAEE